MEKVKILVLGPERSGKTAIVNHVSGFKEVCGHLYHVNTMKVTF